MKVLVLNGPNMNMLGRRDEKVYGKLTLAQICEKMKNYIDWDFVFFQSNHEGDLIDKIQACIDYDAIIINPGGLTHTSICLRDALEIFKGKKVEVHLSDIYARESFRRVNLIADVVDYSIEGEKENGYILAIDYLKSI